MKYKDKAKELIKKQLTDLVVDLKHQIHKTNYKKIDNLQEKQEKERNFMLNYYKKKYKD